mmetsp:Transcript_6936/g.6197  ORF Transcript_6936/g.6197 Transcript_6936/m.6197 type:complete len:89 (+) Transcript_6936:293-559(+)
MATDQRRLYKLIEMQQKHGPDNVIYNPLQGRELDSTMLKTKISIKKSTTNTNWMTSTDRPRTENSLSISKIRVGTQGTLTNTEEDTTS